MNDSVERQIAGLQARLMQREKSAPWPSAAGAFRGVPQPPRGLRATAGSMEATIVWNAPADQRGIAGYHVFQGTESNLISGNLDKNVRQLKVKLSAGTAGLTIKDGVAGTTIWTTAAAAGTNLTFYTPLSSTSGSGMDITLATCGSGNVGTLDVQASQF